MPFSSQARAIIEGSEIALRRPQMHANALQGVWNASQCLLAYLTRHAQACFGRERSDRAVTLDKETDKRLGRVQNVLIET